MRRKFKKIIMVILVLFLFLVFIFIKNKLDKEKYQDIETIDDIKISSNDQNDNNLDDKTCVVDIKGAVNNPGVYRTNCTDNVSDVIRLAGGLADNADTSVTNLAKKITNEMVIIIYTEEEVKNSNIVDTVVKVVEQECVCPNIQNDGCINDEITDTIGGNNSLVNINTATLDQLKKIPGIGDAKALAIIKYREANGNFKNIEDIKNVDGIGSKLYEEIKIYITT